MPDSSLRKSDFSDDRNYSKSKVKKRYKKKKCQKQKKQELSDLLSINSNSSNNSGYRRERRKKKTHQKKDPIKLCAKLTEKFLMTAYKSNIIKSKLYEDPLQIRINVLTFVESLEMIFS